MELQNLKVRRREAVGKGPARRTRASGDVPGVLYGGDGEPVKLSIDIRDFIHLVHGAQGEHAILQLEVEDAPDLSGPAMLKEVQHDPIRGDILHADLLRIDLKQKIHTVVPVRLEGHAIGVVEGGVLDHQCREIEVECLPMDVPEYIGIDIRGLSIGDSFHVADLHIPANVDLLTSTERAVVAVLAPRVIAEPTPAEEEAALAEGEAAEGEEGGEKEEGEGGKKEEEKDED